MLDRWAKWSIEGCTWRWINRLGRRVEHGGYTLIGWGRERELSYFLLWNIQRFLRNNVRLTKGQKLQEEYWISMSFKEILFPFLFFPSCSLLLSVNPLIPQRANLPFFFLEYSLSEISSSFFSRKTYNNSTLSIYLRNHSDYIEESSLFSLLMKNKSFQINEDTPRNRSCPRITD